MQLLYPTAGTDLAAQLARASFAGLAPLTPVDFSWYSGIHPFGYSLLAPWLMSHLGVETCSLVAAVGAAVLFARLTRHTDRPWLAALTGAFFWAANVASGRVTFGLGAVTALAALVLLPRLRWALPCAVITGLFSPVAAAFLGFAAAVLVLRRVPGGWRLGVATTLPVVVLALLFPSGGVQPMSADSARAGILVGLALAVLSTEPMVRLGALLYAGAVAALLFHDDPFGSNVLRLGLLVAVPLLVATTARRTPVVVVVVSLGFVLWQLDPLLADLRSRPSVPLSALNEHLMQVGAQRVEVLAGREHRESAEVVKVTALARGWARQIDVRDNALFYQSEPLQPAAFVGWLRSHSVDRVAVPRQGELDFGSVLEAELLRHPVLGLTQEWADSDWTVYRVVAPRPIVAAPAELLSADRSTLVMWSDRPAAVVVNIRWSRWLSLSGPACIAPEGDRVVVRFRRASAVSLSSSLLPTGHC